MPPTERRGKARRAVATDFGPWIRARRLELERTVHQVARAASISSSYLSRLESGWELTPPSEGVCLALGKALEVGGWEVCRRAGRIPTAIAAELCRSGAWFRLIHRARTGKVSPRDVLEFVTRNASGAKKEAEP